MLSEPVTTRDAPYMRPPPLQIDQPLQLRRVTIGLLLLGAARPHRLDELQALVGDCRARSLSVRLRFGDTTVEASVHRGEGGARDDAGGDERGELAVQARDDGHATGGLKRLAE